MKNYLVNIIYSRSLELKVPAESEEDARRKVEDCYEDFEETFDWGDDLKIVDIEEDQTDD